MTGDSLAFTLFVIALAGGFAATAIGDAQKHRALLLCAIFAVCVISGAFALGYQEIANLLVAISRRKFPIRPDWVSPIVSVIVTSIVFYSWSKKRKARAEIPPAWRYFMGGISDLNAAGFVAVLSLLLFIDKAFAMQVFVAVPYFSAVQLIYCATAPALRFIEGRSSTGPW